MKTEDLVVFALYATRSFGEQVAHELGVSLGRHEERSFEDGEHKTRPLINVRGRDVFCIQSLHGDQGESVNDKLCRLLFFLGALRDASADRVTAVVPYLCYARKDRKTKSRDPVTTRYVAALFEAVGVDRVVAMDVHNPAAFQNAFRCRTDHLEARKLFVEHFAELQEEDVVVVSPDAGGTKRADAFGEALGRRLGKELPKAFLEKLRSGGVVSGEAVVGEVKGRSAVILDDLISSGTTLARAARACRERGAKSVFAAATHGVFVADAGDVLRDPVLDHVTITDTIPFRLDRKLLESRVTVVRTAGLFAEAIRRIHSGGSLVDLLED